MLALKGNQKTSMESALSYMSDATRENLPGLTVHETNDAAHGRKEKRTCRTCQDIGKFPGLEKWTGLSAGARRSSGDSITH